MKEKQIKYLNNQRIDYSKISGSLPLPNLVEIQTDSYKKFITTGIDEVLKDVFPISVALFLKFQVLVTVSPLIV